MALDLLFDVFAVLFRISYSWLNFLHHLNKTKEGLIENRCQQVGKGNDRKGISGSLRGRILSINLLRLEVCIV